jgi:hypothetical protein
MKWVLICVVLVFGILFSLNRPQQQWRDIRIDAGEALVILSEKGIREAGADLDRIENNLLNTQQKIVRLEQLVTPASDWLEAQKKIDYTPLTWLKEIKRTVTPEGLAQLRNDRYEVVTLELVATQDASTKVWDFSSSIKIKDLEKGSVNDVKVINDELNSLKVNLEQQRKAKLDTMALAISTIKGVIETVKSWQVDRVNNMYVFSGPGLGWSNGLSNGTWTYQFAKKEIVPTDNAASILNGILSARR